MPTFHYPRSLVVQFQEDVYKNVGASEILPHLMKCLDADKILAVQFLRAGKVRLTFEDPEVCSAVLTNGLELEGLSVQLMPADDRLRCVYIRDLPVEIDNDVVSSFLSRCGEVLSVDHCYFDDFRHCVMETGWLRFCLLRIFLALFEWKTASAVFGTLVNHLSALFAASLVTVPQPARFLVSAGAVASPVMWPGSVRRFGALLFLFLVLLLMALLRNLILLWNNRLPALQL